MKRVHLIISGRVQGVFFRAETRDFAKKLKLKGWVRNTPNGNVDVVAEGTEKALQQLIQFCKKGHGLAQVTDVKINEEPYSGEFKEFEVRH